MYNAKYGCSKPRTRSLLTGWRLRSLGRFSLRLDGAGADGLRLPSELLPTASRPIADNLNAGLLAASILAIRS